MIATPSTITAPLDAETFNQQLLSAKLRALQALIALIENPNTPPQEVRRAAAIIARTDLLNLQDAPNHFTPFTGEEIPDPPRDIKPAPAIAPSQNPTDTSDLSLHDQRVIRHMLARAREDHTWHPAPHFFPHLHARFQTIYHTLRQRQNE